MAERMTACREPGRISEEKHSSVLGRGWGWGWVGEHSEKNGSITKEHSWVRKGRKTFKNKLPNCVCCSLFFLFLFFFLLGPNPALFLTDPGTFLTSDDSFSKQSQRKRLDVGMSNTTLYLCLVIVDMSSQSFVVYGFSQSALITGI